MRPPEHYAGIAASRKPSGAEIAHPVDSISINCPARAFHHKNKRFYPKTLLLMKTLS